MTCDIVMKHLTWGPIKVLIALDPPPKNFPKNKEQLNYEPAEITKKLSSKRERHREKS